MNASILYRFNPLCSPLTDHEASGAVSARFAVTEIDYVGAEFPGARAKLVSVILVARIAHALVEGRIIGIF